MKKILLFSVAFAWFSLSNSIAQTVFNFENFTLSPDSYWNGSDGSGTYGNTQISFPNYYNTDYYYWSDFAYSNQTDAVTAGYANQYSVFTGNAHSGSVFGLAYISGSSQVDNVFKTGSLTCTFSQSVDLDKIYVANSTYSALSLRDGDAYNTAFTTADDDFFKLEITGKLNDAVVGSAFVMLADYTGAVGSVSDLWQEVDLSQFGIADKLEFVLVSTNGNSYGMTNPAYFCFDDLTYSPTSSVDLSEKEKISIFPNPFVDKITISNVDNSKITVVDISGKTVFSAASEYEQTDLDLSKLKSGLYFLQIENKNGIRTQKIIKN